MLSSALIRQDLVPMAASYLIIMTTLGLGLRGLTRPGPGSARPPGPGGLEPGPPGPGGHQGRRRGPGARAAAERPAGGAGSRRGWVLLARHAIGTAVGGYLLLMAVVIAYYYGVARVGGAFLKSAFTGTALLIGLTLPVFAAASWLTEHRQQRRGTPAEDRRPPRHSP